MVPGHGSRYRNGRGHGRHSLLIHRPLIGGGSEGGRYPSLYSNPLSNPVGPLFAAAAAAAARTRARRGAVSPASSSVTLLTCTTRMPPISRAAVTAAGAGGARMKIAPGKTVPERRSRETYCFPVKLVFRRSIERLCL